MQDIRIDGIGKFRGSFTRLVIDGVGECMGDLEWIRSKWTGCSNAVGRLQ